MVQVADAVALLLVPGMGDDVQALKAGVLEIADVFVINKADRDGADRLEQELRSVLEIARRHDGWEPPILRTVATENKGVAELLAALRGCRFQNRKISNWKRQLQEMLRERLMERLQATTLSDSELEAAAAEVAARRRDPYTFVDEVIDRAGVR